MTWQPDVVIYHDKCIDGFTAAWACHLRWPDAEYIARNYGMAPNLGDIEGKRILIVDFSFPAAVMLDLVAEQKAHSAIILDHHKTAEAELECFRAYANKPERFTLATASAMIEDLRRGGFPPIRALFDKHRSGAGMAWDFSHPDKDRPPLVNLVEDRDLWRFAYGDDSRHLHLALTSKPMEFHVWSDAAEGEGNLIRTGGAIAAYRDSLVDEIVRRAWMTEIDGKLAVTVDCPYNLVSETGHRLLTMHPTARFAAMRVTDQHSITFSLRSEDSREDVSAIASKFGGGGHRNAAGFRVPA